MDKLVTTAIFLLSLSDILINYLLLHIRIEIKIKDKSEAQKTILLGIRKVLLKQITFNRYQMATRILLMIMWIINTMYQRNIVFICYLLAVTYSLMVYFSFQNLKKLKITKHIYETVIKKKLKEEKISKEM